MLDRNCLPVYRLGWDIGLDKNHVSEEEEDKKCFLGTDPGSLDIGSIHQIN